MTQGMRKFLISRERATSQWNLGSFSNLGDWDAEKEITRAGVPGWLALLSAGFALPDGGRRMHHLPKPVNPDDSGAPGTDRQSRGGPGLGAELGEGN